MDLIREKVFVNRYHYDVRNHEWEKENGVPKTNVEVTFQLHNKDEEANNTSVVAVLQFMMSVMSLLSQGLSLKWIIFKTVSSMNLKTSHKKKQRLWRHLCWIRFNV